MTMTSCSKQEAPPKEANIFRINVQREPPTMDPRLGSELIGSAMHFILFEGLMRLNPDGSVTPAQAKAVTVSDDRREYTFHLRDSIWSDGSPVTAHDFEYSWKKILSPDFPAANAHLFYPIKNAEKAKRGVVPLDAVGIRAISDQILVVTLDQPTPYFLDLVSFCVFFPVHKGVDQANPKWASEAGESFVSNGPFCLSSWKHNSEVIFTKNPRYREAGKIYLDQIHVSMIGDENTALKFFEEGQLDMIGLGVSPIPRDALLRYKNEGRLKIQESPGTSIVTFNVTSPLFSNVKIRKAFAYAINRQELVDHVGMLGEEVATNIIPPVLRDHKRATFFKDHDVESAQKLLREGLEELGLTEVPEITYIYAATEVYHKLAQAIQQQWKEGLDVKVTLKGLDHKSLIELMGKKEYQVGQIFWVAQYKDPMNIFERFKYKTNAKNYSNWENPEFVRLLEQSALDTTVEERARTFDAAEAVFMDDMPLAPLYHWKTAFIAHPSVSYPESLPNGAFDYSHVCIDHPREVR
jgi:oligopeptide transport system substrate-binding protein